MSMAPVGYIRIAEVEAQYSGLNHATSEAFENAVREHVVFLEINHKPKVLDGRFLAALDGEMLFVNRREWTISVFHPFENGTWDIAPDHAPDKYETAEQVYAARALTLLDRYGDDFPAATGGLGPASIVHAGMEMAGAVLFLERGEANNLLECLTDPSPMRAMSLAQSEREFTQWVAEFSEPDHPTEADRERWRNERGISRERLRELHSLHSPDYWSVRGRPPQTN